MLAIYLSFTTNDYNIKKSEKFKNLFNFELVFLEAI